MKNKLLKKLISFSIGSYINIFVATLTVPVTTRLLSPEQYGISSLLNTLINALGIICYLGADQGFVRFFYEEKEEDRGRLLYESIQYPCVLILIISIISYIFRNKISIFIVGKGDIFIWKILILSVLVTTLNRFSLLLIRMQQKGKLYSFFNVLLKILEFIFILLLYQKYGNNYKTISISMFLSLLIIVIFSIIAERKMWKFKGKIKTSKKEFIKYSLPFSLTIALNWILGSCDKISIKLLSDIVELGLYSGAFKIIALITVIQTSFTTFWTPVSLEHYSKYPKDLKFYKVVNDYSSLVFFSLGIGLLISRNLIALLLGNEYYESIFIMPMLVFIPIMYLLSETTVLGIYFKKETKYLLYISTIVSIINILGNIILIPYFNAKGAAISTGISYILFFSLKTYFSIKLIDFQFNLKRIYLIIFLMSLYSLILTFYNNIFYNILIGILLESFVLMLYFSEIKELYFKYIKKYK